MYAENEMSDRTGRLQQDDRVRKYELSFKI